MAFRKRNVAIQRAPAGHEGPQPPSPLPAEELVPGVRPSPLTGQPTTSTGVSSLDSYLGGHAGLPFGSFLLIEESGTTDFSGTLLKFFAAEGIAQGHHIHIIGAGPHWARDLPGLTGAAASDQTPADTPRSSSDDKMKIAWRYERLGQHDASRPGGVVSSRTPGPSSSSPDQKAPRIFCHAFDLAKRLALPPSAVLHHIPISPLTPATACPFAPIVPALEAALLASPPAAVHRVLLPSLLSPALYPAHAALPAHVLRFVHALRALLRRWPGRLVAAGAWPTQLYPRAGGVVRWAEHVADAVVELVPFANAGEEGERLGESGGARRGEEKPQGLLRVRKAPAATERGGGLGGGEELAFVLGRRRFEIRPFSLPPVEGEEETVGKKEGTVRKEDIEF